ncbi:malonyl-coenzyme A:anthocyanin 3-O-glucoside-6''-O-malonyltransferase-like [Phoenix dactylifera]|uniref:Malonyl-coenzyme A:anthocyanin 3-O-glucoside-6''-O-malonyltransferase-like n=1 Tax=Phoenix dactylifera TaxID=42345 RepID=A0A8B7CFC7_PHODC|nr:malonyl-coenzyme A:anthocyanin 3-O-glucoside-6''-O-malonyltransferase-like [Phoenix dactylifera]
MASKFPALRVLENSRVSPPPGSVAPASLPLTFFDVIWLVQHPVERLFFYDFPNPIAHFIDSCLPNLKSSLSVTLHHFFPLAGNIRRSPGSDDRYEIAYVDGDSVSFTVAEHDGDFHDFSDDHGCDISKLRQLVPQLPKAQDAQPSLAVQVTVFPNHGIAIGVSINHAACDGSSSMHFMKSWASACKSGGSMPEVAPPPLFDRTLISDPRGLYSVFHHDVEGMTAPEPSAEIPFADMVHATFSLKQDRIQSLKRLVLARAAERETSFHCSTIVVALAYVWVCLVKMRGLASDRKAYSGFAVDCRERLQPPVPASYFGNCVGPCFVEVAVGDVIGEEGFVAAAEAIGKAIEGIKHGILDGAESWLRRFVSILPEQPMTVAGSPKFRVYETDFGWGGPKKVLVTSISGAGNISVAESRAEQGGIEIGMVLPKHVMDEFRTHFLNGPKLIAK